MKVFVINLKRSIERRESITNQLKKQNIDFEIIEALDGRDFKEENLINYVDLGEVKKFPNWLNYGAIACAHSHMKVYQKMINGNLKSALVLEDDVKIPINFKNLFLEIDNILGYGQVVLFYHTSLKASALINAKSVRINKQTSIYPPEVPSNIVMAAAYLINIEAAKGILEINNPVKVAADTWHYFLTHKAIKSLYILFPSPFSIKSFKSSIDYLNPNSKLGYIMEFIDKNKIPVFYQMVRYSRKKRHNKISNNTFVK